MDRHDERAVRCVITRFGLRSARFLLPTYADYRRLSNRAEQDRPAGLLRNTFLLENPSTWYSLSLWSGRPLFSAPVPEHIEAARRVFGRLRHEGDRGPELWSTTWRLEAVSNNLNWGDLDLGGTSTPVSGGAERHAA